ncbi:CBS domain containing protein [Methanocaldococcus bathoardescens]|uniref:CBS domain containing protein n=1 Tax=Methanocaldococcus bathoardescens TaxID=1301915 RepID=A0A076LE32_9EURY|nr:CBS domain-containing protein [Methanocaldococcus bathoardescens]AIJ05032.1 CBS domain containing protein [Methanocaldococcus bathoardescens]
MSKFVKLHLVRTLNRYKELQKIKVKDVMVSGSSVITTTPESTIGEVFNEMIKHDISGMPVIDNRGVMIGYATLKNVGKYLINYPYLKVGEVMIKNPPYTTTDEDIITAFEKMIKFNKKLDQLPVINTKYPEKVFGKLEGIIFMGDIIELFYKYIIKELKNLVNLNNNNNGIKLKYQKLNNKLNNNKDI